MLEVRSFLKKKDDFIPVSDFIGTIPDPDYIEGAIEISYQGKKLLNPLEHWDYVDQLWAYFVNGLVEVSQGREFKTYLPDQPVEIVFKPDPSRQQVTIEVEGGASGRASVEYEEFMRVMLKESKAFFHRMTEILSDSDISYAQELQDLSVLEETN